MALLMFEVLERPEGGVRLTFAGPLSERDETAYLETLELLGRRAGPYVVIASMDGRSPLSAEGRRRQALWFKASRERLAASCRGLVRLTRNETPGHFGNDAFRKALPFPLVETDDARVAEQEALRLMTSGSGEVASRR